ncbi:NAD-dependent epimerase/dehydratase family protein [Leptospira limi]|uniref:NAD-dependent epimerase/dehydratase family protein n=1 Tax=Leptospira limi TaxID=2950023 RepID=A0ABT3LZ28_9LEPT|nr:NAD-dependent epimerase/dehydratase family protein [Leptospira limi]MCW7462985.1 NAD-dependent epimerase/dehydratase family protein [Leptospira limi]
MPVLITGSSGLIGSALAERLEALGKEIYYHSRKPVPSEKKNVVFDLENPDFEGLSLPEFDIVYHLAGQTSIPRAKLDPLYDLQVNLLGFLKLLLHLRNQKKKPIVILAATTTQAGIHKAPLLNELFRDEPVSFYDISKLSAENYLKQFIREGWLLGCSLRLANVYGGTKPGQEQDRGVLDKIFHRALKGETIQIFGDGFSLRDYIHIEDVVSAFTHASDFIEKTNGKHFLIGTGQSHSLADAFSAAVQIASEISGEKSKIEYVNPPAGSSLVDSRSVVYDVSSFKSAANWNPKFSLESGLRYSYGKGI